MNSLFAEFVAQIWPKLSLYVKEKENNGKARTYLHKTMLRNVYSPDQKWEGTSANTTYVTADIVAADSPLPIKMRDSIATSNGTLPKIGMLKQLKETEINQINIMKAHLSLMNDNAQIKAQKQRILTKITDDATSCAVGIDEAVEAAFLNGFSNGVVAIPDENNTGASVRLNYNYLESHSYGVETADVLTVDDLKRVISAAEADGNSVTTIAIALTAYNKLRQTEGAKKLAADYRGAVYTNPANLPVPTASLFDEAFADDNNGVAFLKIDRTVISEKNGVRKPYKPWNENKVILFSGDIVGSLVWGTLAEATNPVPHVDYSTVDSYKLISKYAEPNPLREFTYGQALVAPIIEDVDLIYSIDITEAQAVDTAAETADTEDVYITIWGHKYDKSAVTAALAAIGVTPASNTDAAYIQAINDLNNKKEAALKKALIYYPEVTPAELNFAKTADSTGKEVAVDSNDTEHMASATATTTDAWITPTISDGVVLVKVAANSESSAPARTGSVTVTVGTKTATITVKQAANA